MNVSTCGIIHVRRPRSLICPSSIKPALNQYVTLVWTRTGTYITNQFKYYDHIGEVVMVSVIIDIISSDLWLQWKGCRFNAC
jgi:hypothetical protein